MSTVTPGFAGLRSWLLMGLMVAAWLGAGWAGLAPAAPAGLAERYGKLPLSFEANQGQTDARVKFLARGPGYAVFLTADEAVLTLRPPANPPPSGIAPSRNPLSSNSPFFNPLPAGEGRVRGTQHYVFLDEPFTRAGQGPTNLQSPADPPHPNPLPLGEGAKILDRLLRGAGAEDARGAVLRMRLEGAQTAAPVTGRERLPGTVNYLKGRDPAGWRTGVATFGRVEYRGVYPGIDLVYYGHQRSLEYDFVVAPGADPRQIRLSFAGEDPAAAPRLEANGDLRLLTAAGAVRLRKPVVYQEIDGRRRAVEGRFVMRPPPASAVQAASLAQVGFQVGDYDPTRPLVIDPVLAYSTYLGGSSGDGGSDIAVDGAGNAYVTGTTASSDFPKVNARYPKLWGDSDAFVLKLSAGGQTVRYSTYLGGSADDYGSDIAVDGVGNAYVTGSTMSSDFPVVKAKYPKLWGYRDAFVFKLSADGQTVRYSTYLGGSSYDDGFGMAVDGAGNAHVTGRTTSNDFPTVKAKYPKLWGYEDAFLFKLSTDGQTVRYSTYLGGSGEGTGLEQGFDIAVDGAGNAYVTGTTDSNDFPTVNAKYPKLWGWWDAFVFKLSADGQTVRYSTYLGGSNQDWGYGIAVDGAGNAYVTGDTWSDDFPKVKAKYPKLWGQLDAFVFKLSPNGQTVRYSTYLGGSSWDQGNGIAVDGAGNAHVTGYTWSYDFPMVYATYPQWRGSQDAFVFKLSADGQTVRYSTYLGGSGGDGGSGIAVDGAGNAYVTGGTGSGDFPTSATDPNIVSYDPNYNGNGDAFLAKLIPGDSPDSPADLAVTLRREGATPLYLGDSDTLTLTLVNRGPALAPGVTLSLPIPEGLSASTGEPDCAVSNQVLSCALGDLNAKALASRSVKLTVTGPQKASAMLTATGTSGAYDPAPGNNRASLTLSLNPRIAVVLVHGWNGSPDAFSGDDQFLKPSGQSCAPSETYLSHGCLPRLGHALRADAGLLVAQPFDYSDKTPLGDWSIEQLAGELHKHIQCVKRGECMADKKPVDRVDIVAHSMGGLISRAYIAGMALDKDAGDAGIAYDGSLRRLVTVGTPHYGVTIGRLTQALRQSPAGPRTPAEIKLTVQGDELAFGSPFVWNLNAYWEERVVKTGAFPASNLLTLRGWADFDCNANYFDGIVDLASATLPNDALQPFLPDSQVRQAFAKHKPWLCFPARPALVALPKSNQSNPGGNRIYQLVRSFLDGTIPPANLTPPATYLNKALVLVRLVDKTTGDPVNIAPILGFNASLKFDEITLPEDVELNEAAATLTASPVPLKDSRQTATLRIIPPSGYLAPPARKITLYAGRPTIREIALEPKP